MEKRHVHRGLQLWDKGEDVKGLQHGIRRMADHWNLPWLIIEADGVLGPRTMRAASNILYVLGTYGRPMKRARHLDQLSQYAQRLIRGSRRWSPVMHALSLKRRNVVREWRQNYRKSIQGDQYPRDQVIRRVEQEVDRLSALNLPYVFGGGHVTPVPPNGPFDCSSFVSRLWQLIDPDLPTGTTYTLADAGVEGVGDRFSLYINNVPGKPDWSHVIVRIDNRWAQCGGRDNPTPGGGPTWFEPDQARINEFQTRRHPKGF